MYSVNYTCAWTYTPAESYHAEAEHILFFSCHRGAGPLQFSTSPLGICSTSFCSGVGQRPLFCNCASQFIWLNVASAAILAGLLVTSAINPHTSVNKLITSWGQKSPLFSHHHNIQTALCEFFRGRETKRGGVRGWQIIWGIFYSLFDSLISKEHKRHFFFICGSSKATLSFTGGGGKHNNCALPPGLQD